MNPKHIIQAWRDEEYRESLDAVTRSQLPENPAGEIELTEFDLTGANGGATSITVDTNPTAVCDSLTVTIVGRFPIQDS